MGTHASEHLNSTAHNDRNSSSKWDALLASWLLKPSGVIWRVAWFLRGFSKGRVAISSVLAIFSSSVFIEVDSWPISGSVMLLWLLIGINTIWGCAWSFHIDLFVSSPGNSTLPLAIWRSEIILSWWWVMRSTLGWEPLGTHIIQISLTLNILNRDHFVGWSIIRFIGRSVSVGYYSGLDFVLRASYNIIDPSSNWLNLSFSVKSLSNLVIGFNEALKFFLKAVVLIVEIGHVLVQCIDFSLQINLISHHLLWMWFESVNLIFDWLFILFAFLRHSNQLLLS